MSGFPRSETFLFQLHSFDQPVEKFPFAVNRAPRLEGPPRAASLPPSMAYAVLTVGMRLGKRYGCLAKRSMVFAGCDAVAAPNRLISKNCQPVT
jgi:hypothetical protein